MKSLDSTVKKTGTAYNPAKYVRGYRILQGVNVNELPNVQNAKKTEKYSYEEYLKSKNQNTANTGPINNPTNLNITNTRIDNNPNQFSYEQYKQTKQSNKSNDNINSPEDYNKVSNSFYNKINLNNNLPPTSNFNNNPVSNQSNPHNFLNFELTKQGMNQTTLLTPIEDTLQAEQMKDTDSFNPYSALSFDNTPQQPKNTYGGSYMAGNYNVNDRSQQLNPNRSQMNMNSSSMPGRNFNMPNYNNGYNPNNYNNQGNYPNNNNNNFNNPGNQKFPK
jgi:hypothetical protein